MKNFFLTEKHFPLLALLLATLTILPIAILGIPNGNDLPQHFQFADIFYNSLTNGDGFPSWANSPNAGYGDVGIRFYPPLGYYTLAIARFLVGNWYDATWLNFLFWMLLGCCGVYYWARCWFSVKESSLSLIFYAIIPYHLTQIYLFFNYSEFVGAAILPFCFAFLTRIFMRRQITDVFGLAICYALLILSHIPLSIIGSVCLFVYALTLLRKDNFIQPLKNSALGIFLGLAASAFYWVIVISEMKWLNHSSDKYISGIYSFRNHFFPFYFDPSAEYFNWTHFISTDFPFILNLLLLGFTVIYFVYRKNRSEELNNLQKVVSTVFPLGLFVFFMITPLSRPIWELFTPLQRVQLPSRWLAVAGMCGAILAAASVSCLISLKNTRKRLWIYSFGTILFGVFFFNSIFILHPIAFNPIGREKFETQLRQLPAEESFECWWTIWSKRSAFENKEKVLVDSRDVKIISWHPEDRSFEISEGNASAVRIGTFYYPLWQATVNGNPVEVGKDDNGAIIVPVGNEKSTVRLYFQEPFYARTASILSLLTWFCLISSILWIARKKFLSAEIFSSKSSVFLHSKL